MDNVDNHALAERIRGAYEHANLLDLEDALDPKCTWGAPGDPNPQCTSKGDVLRWYRAAMDAGMHARVIDSFPLSESILVGVMVSGRDDDPDERERWQSLKIQNGLIVDIAGFESREDAMRFATTGELPPEWT